MLSEAGVIVMAALIACGFVILGTLELISPTRPRRPRRTPPAPEGVVDPGATEPDEEAAVASALPLEPAPAARLTRDAPAPILARQLDLPSAEAPIERLLREQATDAGADLASIPAGVPPAAPEPSPLRAAAAEVDAPRLPADGHGPREHAPEPPAATESAPPRPARERARRGTAPRRRREVVAEATRTTPEAVPPAYEASHLTAAAVRCVDEREDQAMAALDRAEAFLRSVSEETLPRGRRRELERRLWWGYTKLGSHWVERRRWDEALEPLLRALAYTEVGPERYDETRELLSHALTGMVEGRLALVADLTEGGDREGALAVADMLRAVLDTAVERGLDRSELEEAFSRMDALLDRVGAGR